MDPSTTLSLTVTLAVLAAAVTHAARTTATVLVVAGIVLLNAA